MMNRKEFYEYVKSEESRADGQQKKNEPSHDQKGVKAYDEQKRIL